MTHLERLSQVGYLAAQSRVLIGLDWRERQSDVPYVERREQAGSKELCLIEKS